MAKMTLGEPTSAARPDPDFPPGVAYVDGRFCPISEAKISVLDWGFLHSDATYDVVHVWKRRFFRLEDHLDRFQRSVAKLRMTLRFDREALREVLMECVRRTGFEDAYVEMICTRGHTSGYGRDPPHARPPTASQAMCGRVLDRPQGLGAREYPTGHHAGQEKTPAANMKSTIGIVAVVRWSCRTNARLISRGRQN